MAATANQGRPAGDPAEGARLVSGRGDPSPGVVRRYDVLDTPPDRAFDAITAIAARLLNVPVAVVSIVEEDRIRFKSRHGLELHQLGRDPGLRASAILQEEPWVVTDARTDPGVLGHTLDAGAPGFRFYAGVPLTLSDGHNLGALCVMDERPRQITEAHLATLVDLAAVVVDELELRVSARRTTDLEEQLRSQANVLTADTVQATMQRIVELAVDTIECCDHASISVLEGTRMATQASSDPRVADVDVLQHETGEGPCLDVITQETTTVYAEDLTDDPRWPRFGPRAAAAGMRSLLAIRLLADRTIGALNLYARLPRAYGATDRATGVIFATHAGIALAAAEARTEAHRVEHLEQALSSRELIGQAQGILMERERITPDQAFDVLRRASQHLNLKLREVAQRLVDTGERPATGTQSTGTESPPPA
jgi:GAF domain-containing protein